MIHIGPGHSLNDEIAMFLFMLILYRRVFNYIKNIFELGRDITILELLIPYMKCLYDLVYVEFLLLFLAADGFVIRNALVVRANIRPYHLFPLLN